MCQNLMIVPQISCILYYWVLQKVVKKLNAGSQSKSLSSPSIIQEMTVFAFKELAAFPFITNILRNRRCTLSAHWKYLYTVIMSSLSALRINIKARIQHMLNFQLILFFSLRIYFEPATKGSQIVSETRSANNLRLMRIIKGAFWSDALTRPNYYFCFCGRAWHKSLFTLTAGRDGQSRSKRLRFYLLIDTCPACSSFSGRSCCVIRKEATVTALYVFDVQISQTRPLCFDAAQSLESKQTTRSAHIL